MLLLGREIHEKLKKSTFHPKKTIFGRPHYQQLSITVNPAVAVLLISDNNFYWDGGSAQLTAITSPAGSYTYDWYRDNLLVLANGGDIYTSAEPARFAAYNYHVTVNDRSCTRGIQRSSHHGQ